MTDYIKRNDVINLIITAASKEDLINAIEDAPAAEVIEIPDCDQCKYYNNMYICMDCIHSTSLANRFERI